MSEILRLPSGRFLPGTAPGPGRDPIFKTPQELWDKCLDYFEWVEHNPLKASQVISFQGVGTLVEVPKMRAMTIGGLCIHLDIDRATWNDYASQDGFSSIATRAEEFIRCQKFEGASADLLNANIIARELGLADKSDLNHSGEMKLTSAIDATGLSDATLAELLKAKQKPHNKSE